MGGPRVVLLADANVLDAGIDTRALLEKARACLEKEETAPACRALTAVLGFHRLSPAEVDADVRRQLLAAAELDPADDAWLEALVDHCRGHSAPMPSAEGQAEALVRAVEKGFPAGHHLILTTAGVDRRRKIYKAIEAAAVVVDASVPLGGRRADLETQQRLLQDQVRRILGPSGKHLDPEAYQALVEMTGFDLRTFCSGLEKLVDYCGPRPEITADDVHEVLKRSKKDPIYALTGAVGDRRLEPALVCLDSILETGTHLLQVLAALTNLVRRLMVARAFLDSPGGGCWQRRMDYRDFQQRVVPALLAHDRDLADQVGAWQTEPADGGAKRQAKMDTDLVLVKNPKSVYPVFQLLRQAETFSAPHLGAVVERLCAADRALKTSAGSPRWVVESLLWFICQGGAPHGPRKRHPSDSALPAAQDPHRPQGRIGR
jgi:DNA polymerase-3 subunit delta